MMLIRKPARASAADIVTRSEGSGSFEGVPGAG
jgi:hypothetical protein